MKITKFALNTMLLSTSLIVGQLQAAPAIDPEKLEQQPLGSIGPIELSNNDLGAGPAKGYRGWFENGSWQGDLVEYSVGTNGLLDSSIDTSGASPVEGPANLLGEINWSANVEMSQQDADWWDTGRIIITVDSDGSEIPFRWDDLSDDQRVALDPISAAANADFSEILDFIRGNRGEEVGNNGPLRERFPNVTDGRFGPYLGDIVHSNPEYVGAPEDTFTDSSYVAFKNTQSDRHGRVYVGANDGMLHAFYTEDAEIFGQVAGQEAWAYIPSMLFHKLTRLSGTPYSHRYYVDGGITVRDAQLNGDWKTVLVGSLGAGGKGLYALDVTDPVLADESTGGKVMGELGADHANGNDIGYIFDATTITQLNDGKWYAINGNGINSVNGVAQLVLIQLESGNVKLISTGSGGTGAGEANGLAAPALLDRDGDGKSDFAWAGDLNGDMWRFDLTDLSPTGWDVDYKLFSGSSAQPITQAPDITNHPQFGYLVLFATGKLYEADDVSDKTVQSVLGVWDKGATVTKATMLLQPLSTDLTYDVDGADELVRTFNPVNTLEYGDHPGGWYINLPGGERVLTPPAIRAGRLKTTVTDPDGFSNWFLEATFDEGSAEDETIFDLNGDTVRTVLDRVDGNGNNDTADPEDIPMGWKQDDGNMSQVTIARLEAGEDTLFLNFLNPPLVEAPEPCSGECDGGLIGGHMDVDSDLVYGGGTDKDGGTHKHEYDITHNRTYIDYFDIDPAGEGKPQFVTDGVTDPTQKIIVTIANADWSPGATLRLGNVEYNVVVYQAMLHEALFNWKVRDGLDPDKPVPADGLPMFEDLTDPQGEPLVHTLNTLRADGGTLRNTFLATALEGGLIPSKTSCVNSSLLTPNNRWRTNALTMHVVDAEYVRNLGTKPDGNPEQPLDRLRVQDVTKVEAGDDCNDKDCGVSAADAAGGSFYERIVLSDGTMIKLTNDDGENGLEGGSPKYEVYGGITAANSESFLYESTVFWHWNDGLPDICWANTEDYRTKFKTFTGRTAVGVFLSRLEAETGFESFAELVAAMEALEERGCSNSSSTTGGCSETAAQYQELFDDGMLVYQVPSGASDDLPDEVIEGQSGNLTGKPIAISESGITGTGKTSGPNFQSGRRTWTDILSE